MAIVQQPVPGYYYTDQTGQLIKVKMLLYKEGQARKVCIEYHDGHRHYVPIHEWDWLDLAMYTEWLNTARRAE